MVKRDDGKKKRAPEKKKGGGRHDEENDDSSVDSRGNIRGLIEYSSDTEEEQEQEEETPVKKRRLPLKKVEKPKKLKKLVKEKRRPLKKHVETESEEDEEDDDGETLGSKDTEEEEEENDFEDFDNEEDDTYEEEDDHRSANLVISFGAGESADRMIPQRHNMKKEPASVKQFVKLLTAPLEDNTIDAQIDQFKALTEPKQKELLTALENRPTMTDTGVNLMLRILTLKLPVETQAHVLAKYNSLQTLDPSTGEYFKLRNWLDKVVSVPFGLYKEIAIKLEDGSEACAKFMQGAQKSLNDAVYGQEDTKLQILQYITTKIANPSGRGTSLLLVGPPGIGKTSVIKNGIAKALGLPFQFISLGGDSDASTYTGHQLVYESSHCGKIVNSLIASKSMSTIILFDEVDKISATPKGEEVQNMLIHLTDPASNEGFEDKYLAGVPIDLSKVIFVFSANDITKIDRVLLDRLMTIELKGYDLKQKTTIAEQYLLPAALKDVNLVERVAFGAGVVSHIIEQYAREEMGVRELKRSIEQIVQKINMLRLYNDKALPFHIKDFALPFTVKKEHVDLFLKKKEGHAPPFGMYT
jgi:ATP-dependent Lon protease